MSDNKNGQERKPELAGERLGVALFLVGVLPLVLVGVALFKGQVPGETQASGIAAAALRLVRAFGYFPSLLLFGGVSVVGGALFLGQNLRNPGQHLLGLVGLSLGLAALLGAVLPPGGGRIGEALGGSLAQGLGPWAGAAMGVIIMGATAVFAWMGGKVPLPKKPGRGATLTTALSDLDRDGVSNAETHALVPDASTLKYMEELWGPKEATQVEPIPPSPYPEDVRLKGEIPKGAAPLVDESTDSDEAQTTPESSDAPADHATRGEGGEDTPPVAAGEGSHDPHRWKRSRKESSSDESADSDLGAEPVKSAPTFRIVGGTAHDDQDSEDRSVDHDEDPAAPLPNQEAAEAIEAAEALRAEVQASADDPFGLHTPEEQALADLIGLDPGQQPVPEVRELPKGTRPLVMDAPTQAGAEETTQPVAPGAPPRPVWERAAQPEATQAEPISAADVEPEALEAVEADEAEAQSVEVADDEASSSEPESSQTDGTPVENADLEIIERDWMRAWEEAGQGTESETEESEHTTSAEGDLFADAPSAAEELAEDWEAPTTVAEALQEAETAEDLPEEPEAELEEELLEEPEAEYEEEDLEDEDVEDPDAEYEQEEEGEYDEEEEAEYEEDPEAEYEEDAEEEDAEYEEEEYEEEEEPVETGELEEGEEYEEQDEEAEYEEEDPEAEYEEEGDSEEEEEYEEGEYDEEGEEEYEDDPEAEYEEDEEGQEEESEYEDEEEGEYEEDPEAEYEEEESELEEEDPEAEEAAELDEPEVEIEPAAAGGTPASRSKTWSREDLVREAGAFLIERRRVGVSLLQRQFELDFETASELLAEFEEVGLIGPYMGGQKRAILLDQEAWQERCTSS